MAKRRGKRSHPSPGQSLRRRLQEAEDTLAAIREGHIDALVIRAPDGEQIYSLRTADQPYRLILEQMREGALTLSADGVVLYCNARFAELLGHSSIDIIGHAFATFVAPEECGKLSTLLSAETFRDECHLLFRDGTSVATQLSATALVVDGLRTTAVVVSDLTPERTEKALRESNRLKDEFLATLSHELRTPLNVILGWTQMLLTNQLSASTRRRALELIDKNARSQAQIVADLVDMSRITSGKLSLDVLPLPVAPALESAVDSVRLAAEAKGVSIHTTAHPDDMVLADATRLQQILWNLLSNAVKFTPAGGQIQLRAQRHGDQIAIEVTDSGIGIDTRFLPHVFERFRQAESGSTRGYSGLGLGLAIVHDLVRLHGGTVEARSAGIGSGATFVVSLPRAEIVTSEQSAQRRPPNNHYVKGKVILLIEDHEDTRELTAQILRQAGMNVVPCASANAAFAVLHDQLPSAIVADIGLPDEDGISFIKRVRRHSSAHVRAVPAIALTAYTSAAEQEDALRAGFQRHIGKPVEPGYLIDALRDILRAGSDG